MRISSAGTQIFDQNVHHSKTLREFRKENEDNVFAQHMPDSIYAATLVYWMQLDTVAEIVTFVSVIGLFIFTVTIQAMLSLYLFVAIDRADGDLSDTCGSSDALLRWGCCILFSALIVKDLLETVNMGLWLSMVRRDTLTRCSGRAQWPKTPTARR